MATIGVSIAVPEPHGSLLRDKRAEFGDPMARTVPSHVTLVPPTEVDDERLACLDSALEDAAAALPRFTMRLRGTGTFRPVSPVVFVAVSQGISYTEMLAQRIRSKIEAPEPSFPFHPHVTVAQNLDDEALDRAYADLAEFSADFTVTEFALYLDEGPAGWVPRRTYALRGDA